MDGCKLVPEGGVVEGRVAVVVGHFEGGTARQQQRHQVGVALVRRHLKARLAAALGVHLLVPNGRPRRRPSVSRQTRFNNKRLRPTLI